MKPVPRKCGKCGQGAIAPTVLDYPAEFDHDGRPYQFIIPALRVLRCEKCGRIVLDDEANERITEEFRQVAQLLTPEEIRAGRTKIGLNQQQLAACLQVSNATVSRWESGGQIQQRAMDLLMRTFFDVAAARQYLAKVAGVELPSTATPLRTAAPTG